MAGYIGGTAVVSANGAERKKTYTITGTTTSLTGLSYTVNQVHVFHNGVRLVDGTDFTATNGNSITLTSAAESGDEVVVLSYAGYQVSDTVSASQGGTFSGDVTIDADLSVDGGTIKLDGNYPVGTNNVALGDAALDDGSLSGGNNVAIGNTALSANTTGYDNTSVGASSLLANTTGHTNTAVGGAALNANTTGQQNIALGNAALLNSTTGSYNTAIGRSALLSNTTANGNTAVGYQAGYANTTGNVTALGFFALNANTTGATNTAVGDSALRVNTTGASNVAVGVDSLRNNNANYNTAVGRASLRSTTSGIANTAVGDYAGYSNTTGTKNVVVGAEALNDNTTGSYNTALGMLALHSNTTASNNTAVGYQAGYSITTGQYNLFVGPFAGYNSTGTGNTFVGSQTAGYGCGDLVTTGSKNTILGAYSGNQGGLDIRTSSNNIVLSDGDGNPRTFINNAGGVSDLGDTIKTLRYFVANSSFNNPTMNLFTASKTAASYPQTAFEIKLYGTGMSANKTQHSHIIGTFDYATGSNTAQNLKVSTVHHTTVDGGVAVGIVQLSGNTLQFIPNRQTNYDSYRVEVSIYGRGFTVTFDKPNG